MASFRLVGSNLEQDRTRVVVVVVVRSGVCGGMAAAGFIPAACDGGILVTV